jgi:hypothetical protein
MAFGQYLGYIVGAVGAIVGGVIGLASGGGYNVPGAISGAIMGWSIGYSIGGVAGQVFWPEKAEINTPPPPQPYETRLQFSSWGMAIPIQYGSGRMAGNIIYMSDIVETIDRSKHRQDGVRYYEMIRTYTATFAIAFCEGPVTGIARIWMNNKIFVDFRDPDGPNYPSGSIALASGNLDTSIARSVAYFSIHFGEETQAADTALVALLTDAETPAYRGMFYLVFIDFPIGEFSGVPAIEVEIGEVNEIVAGSPGVPPSVWTSIDLDLFTEVGDSGDTITEGTDWARINRTTIFTFSDARIEYTIALPSDITFRYKVTVTSLGSHTSSSRVLRLLRLYWSGGDGYINSLWFNNGSPTYNYSIGQIAEGSNVYTSIMLTRYIQVTKLGTNIKTEIFTDSGYSTLEFTENASSASFSAAITKIAMLDSYSATATIFDVLVENLKYKVP